MKDEPQVNFEKVMVIDDNLIDLYIAARMITKNSFGRNILQYSSAFDALKYLQDNQGNTPMLPQVIFVDIYMPGMSGFEFMSEYEKLPTSLKNYCRVFFISSSKCEQDVEKARTDKYIIDMKEKPITKEFLNEVKISCSSSMAELKHC